MRFIRSFCTDTRLMGTVMMAVEWEEDGHEISHIFVLDFEGLGVTYFQELRDVDPKVKNIIYRNKSGGLGGEFVDLDQCEARYLLKKYIERNIDYKKPLPENLSAEIIAFYRFFDKDTCPGLSDASVLMNKIIKPFDSDTEFVNYMIMRLIARDRETLLFFSGSEEVSMQHLTEINGTLLFNSCEEKSPGRFSNICLYEDKDGYYEARIIVNFSKENGKYRLLSFWIVDSYPVSPDDVFMAISMSETIDCYSLNMFTSEYEIMDIIRTYFPGIQENEFEKGVLFTMFREDNGHVNSPEYCINNDIEFNLYVSGKKIFAACYDDDTQLVLEEEMDSLFSIFIDERVHYEFPFSILLDFIDSDFSSLDDYLKSSHT